MNEHSKHLTIDKRQALMGLKWRLEPLVESMDSVFKRVANEFGAEYGLALESKNVSVAGVNATIGLVLNATTIDKNTFSAAQWFVDFIEKPTILVKRFPDDGKYWIVGGSPGEIDTTLDLIVNEDDMISALAQARDHLEREDTEYLLFQDNCTGNEAYIDQARSVSIEEIFESKPPLKHAKIRKVKPAVTTKGAVGIALIAIILVSLGGWYINKQYQKIKGEREMAQMRLAADRQAAMRKTLRGRRILEAINEALKQDTHTPEPLAYALSCYSSAVHNGPLTAGWWMNEGSCSTNVLTAKWKLKRRTPSTDRLLYESLPDTRWNFGAGADEASNSIKLYPVDNRASAQSIDALPDWKMFNINFTTALQMARIADPKLSWKITSPSARSIKYVDPDKEGGNNDYAQTLSDVPADQGYKAGTIKINGKSFWRVAHLPLNKSNISISNIKFKYTQRGDTSWEINASYLTQ